MGNKYTADQVLDLIKGKVIQDIQSEVIAQTPYKRMTITVEDPDTGKKTEVKFTVL